MLYGQDQIVFSLQMCSCFWLCLVCCVTNAARKRSARQTFACACHPPMIPIHRRWCERTTLPFYKASSPPRCLKHHIGVHQCFAEKTPHETSRFDRAMQRTGGEQAYPFVLLPLSRVRRGECTGLAPVTSVPLLVGGPTISAARRAVQGFRLLWRKGLGDHGAKAHFKCDRRRHSLLPHTDPCGGIYCP